MSAGWVNQGWSTQGWVYRGWVDAGSPVTDSGGGGGIAEGESTWLISYRKNGTDVVKHTFAWVSNSSGNATLSSGIAISGEIQRVVFVPSAAASPTALYDVTLTDEDGIDVFAGQGENLSATVALSVCPGTPFKDGTTIFERSTVVDSILTLNVSNAGDSKAGKVVVYVR